MEASPGTLNKTSCAHLLFLYTLLLSSKNKSYSAKARDVWSKPLPFQPHVSHAVHLFFYVQKLFFSPVSKKAQACPTYFKILPEVQKNRLLPLSFSILSFNVWSPLASRSYLNNLSQFATLCHIKNYDCLSSFSVSLFMTDSAIKSKYSLWGIFNILITNDSSY